MAERRVFSREFKANAVELASRGDKSVSEVAKDLGIPENRIYHWRKEARRAEAEGTKAFPGQGNPRDEELARLRKRNKELEEINAILKKAAAILLIGEPR